MFYCSTINTITIIKDLLFALMADTFASSLYRLTTSELREVVFVLCMERKAKNAAIAHMNIMHSGPNRTETTNSSTRTLTPTTPTRGSAPSRLFPNLLPPATPAGKVSKSANKPTPKKQAKVAIKRTTLYHTCQKCHNRFRQQDNTIYACSYHPGLSTNSACVFCPEELMLMLANQDVSSRGSAYPRPGFAAPHAP